MTDQTEFRAHHYRSADDRLDLFARDYSPPGPGRNRLPLLMMHGLTRNSADFEPLAGHLAGSRRMVVPDQRGRGLSAHDPEAANYRPEVYVQDMWTLLDDLGLERVILIGTSMGGLMAMIMGATRPRRVAGIILNDIGPMVSKEGLDRIQGYVGGSQPMANWQEAAARCQSINGDALQGFRQEDWLAFARRTCVELADGRVAFAYDPGIATAMSGDDPAAVPADMWPLWDMLAAIPVLVIRGAHSDILSPGTVKEMAQRHWQDFTAIDIPGRGHAPILDEPAALSAIDGFLSAHG
jgi:pimeloyl-ACP methyl ester carboxylesterase